VRDALLRTVWYGDGFAGIIARAVLTPAEWAYGAASLAVGALRARRAGVATVPTISVGNLTVGGTGKTPVAAWVAAQLRRRGRRPALLLRGYGDDEALVHAVLNPQVPVVAHPDRRRGASAATAQGADALVLDDAFQHRQMPRDVDVVLVSADAWHEGPARLLPAGPFREPLIALQRATLVLVTRKAVEAERAALVAARLRAHVDATPIGIAHLRPDDLRVWGGEATASLEALRDAQVLAVSGIGAPEAFGAQLEALGARVAAVRFADHHDYRPSDVADLVRRAARADRVVCTLKDAVKLGPRWPADAPPLWYLSQAVVLETGGAAVHAELDRLAVR